MGRSFWSILVNISLAFMSVAHKFAYSHGRQWEKRNLGWSRFCGEKCHILCFSQTFSRTLKKAVPGAQRSVSKSLHSSQIWGRKRLTSRRAASWLTLSEYSAYSKRQELSEKWINFVTSSSKQAEISPEFLDLNKLRPLIVWVVSPSFVPVTSSYLGWNLARWIYAFICVCMYARKVVCLYIYLVHCAGYMHSYQCVKQHRFWTCPTNK